MIEKKYIWFVLIYVQVLIMFLMDHKYSFHSVFDKLQSLCLNKVFNSSRLRGVTEFKQEVLDKTLVQS